MEWVRFLVIGLVVAAGILISVRVVRPRDTLLKLYSKSDADGRAAQYAIENFDAFKSRQDKLLAQRVIIRSYILNFDRKNAEESIEKLAFYSRSPAEALSSYCLLYHSLDEPELMRGYADKLIGLKKPRDRGIGYVYLAINAEKDGRYEDAYDYHLKAAELFFSRKDKALQYSKAFAAAIELGDMERADVAAKKSGAAGKSFAPRLDILRSRARLAADNGVELEAYLKSMVRLKRDYTLDAELIRHKRTRPDDSHPKSSHTGGRGSAYIPAHCQGFEFFAAINYGEPRDKREGFDGVLEFYISRDIIAAAKDGLMPNDAFYVALVTEDNAAVDEQVLAEKSYFPDYKNLVFSRVKTSICCKDPQFAALTEQYSGVKYETAKKFFDFYTLFPQVNGTLFGRACRYNPRPVTPLPDEQSICLLQIFDGQCNFSFHIPPAALTARDFSETSLYIEKIY